MIRLDEFKCSSSLEILEFCDTSIYFYQASFKCIPVVIIMLPIIKTSYKIPGTETLLVLEPHKYSAKSIIRLSDSVALANVEYRKKKKKSEPKIECSFLNIQGKFF